MTICFVMSSNCSIFAHTTGLLTLTTAYIYKTQTLVSYGSENYYIKQSRERIDQCLG